MDFIVMLIIFGVISALGKSTKKQPQSKRPGSSFPQSQRPRTTSASPRPFGNPTAGNSKESLQESLTTIFNALAGEMVLKSPEEKRREEERAQRMEEVARRASYEGIEGASQEVLPTVETPTTTPDMVFSDVYQQEEEEGLQIITLGEDEESSSSFEFELDLLDAKKGIIWSEILDKPLSVRK